MMLKKQTLPGGQDVRTNQPPPYISADGPSSFFKSLGLLSPASELTRGTQIPISSKNTKVKNCLVNLDRLRAKGDPHAVENYDSIALGCKSLPADKGGETIIEATQRKFAEAKRFFAPLSDIATGTVRGTGDTWKKVGSGTIGFFKGITENWKMLILFGIVASVLYITLMYKRV